MLKITTKLFKKGNNIIDKISNKPKSDEQKRGSIAFFATYRPPVALDLYATKTPPTSPKDEVLITDGESYNYNGQAIPPSALKLILKRPQLADVDSGRLWGHKTHLIFTHYSQTRIRLH